MCCFFDEPSRILVLEMPIDRRPSCAVNERNGLTFMVDDGAR